MTSSCTVLYNADSQFLSRMHFELATSVFQVPKTIRTSDSTTSLNVLSLNEVLSRNVIVWYSDFFIWIRCVEQKNYIIFEDKTLQSLIYVGNKMLLLVRTRQVTCLLTTWNPGASLRPPFINRWIRRNGISLWTLTESYPSQYTHAAPSWANSLTFRPLALLKVVKNCT